MNRKTSTIALLILLSPIVLLGRTVNKGITVTSRQIRVALKSYIENCFKGSLDRFEIEYPRSIPEIHLLRQPDSIVVSHQGETPPLGNEVFKVVFYDDQLALRSLNLAVKVHVYRKVWRSCGVIERDRLITKELLEIAEEDISSVAGKTISVSDNINGFHAKRTIPAGSVLTHRYLRLPYLINKGHHLDVLLVKGVVKITLNAKALQNGVMGDWVWVKNPDTLERMKVKVVGPGLCIIP